MRTISLHIYSVLKRSEKNYRLHGYLPTASSYISCVLRWSGTYLRVYGSLRNASSHISCVLRWPATNSRLYGTMHTASLHISCVFKWSGTKKTSCIACSTLFRCTSLSFVSRESQNSRLVQALVCRRLYTLLPCCTSLLSYTDQGHGLGTTDFFQQLLHTFSLSWSDKERLSAVMGLFSMALSHILCVFKLSDTYFSVYAYLPTASSHISLVLRWSGTNFRLYGSVRTASSHISCVLRWSVTYANEGGFMLTAFYISLLSLDGRAQILGCVGPYSTLSS